MRNPGDDPAILSASPVHVILRGRTYLVRKLSPRRMGTLQSALNAIVPDPREVAKAFMVGQSDAVAIHIYNKACEEARDWPLKLTSEAGTMALFTSPDGTAAYLEVLLGGVNANFDRRAAEELAEVIDLAELTALLAASGPGDPNAPKAGAGTATPEPGAS